MPPPTPTKDQIIGALDEVPVRFYCTREQLFTSKSQFGLDGTRYDVTEPKLENGSYTCTVTVYADEYLRSLNNRTGFLQHTLDDEKSKTITLTYNSTSKRWTASPNSVTFNVFCVEPEPAKPSDNFLLRLPIGIRCTNDDRTHSHDTNEIKLIPGSYTVGAVQKDDSGYFCTITVTAKDYVDKFSGDEETSHVLASGEKDSKEFTVRWAAAWYLPNGTVVFDVVCESLYFYTIQRSYFTGNKYDGCATETITGIRPGTTVYVKDLAKVTTFKGNSYEYVRCSRTEAPGATLTTEGDPGITINGDGGFFEQIYTRTTPKAPEAPDGRKIKELLGDNAVVIACTVNSAHAEKAYALLDGSCTTGEVVDDGNGSYHCDVTVSAAPYVTEYSEGNVAHKLAATESGSKTVRLAYNSADGWHIAQQSSVPLRFSVQCETVYYSYKVVHVYRTNDVEDGRTAPATYPSVVSGTVVSADNITKALTYNGNTYEYTSAAPEQAAIDSNNVVFTLYYDRTVEMCTVTYTDGADGEEVFPDQEYTVAMGEATPAFC